MRRIVAVALALMLLWPASAALALPKGAKVVQYVGGLSSAVDIAWVPRTDKIFFTQQGGRVGVIDNGHELNRACITLDVNSAGERGALGIAVHPDFKQNHYLYVFYTNASPLEHRVDRFTVRDNRCRNRTNIISGLSASSSGYHNGGQLDFIKGHLFVTTGEGHDPAFAQDTSSRLGKVLRYNPDGSIPNDNPFGDSNSVWTYGHRNGFGLTHNPHTGLIYQTENGPDCDDELNLIRRGRNYGWGTGYNCGNPVGPDPKAPMKKWTPTIVPTDPWWYFGRMESLTDSLYMGDYGTGRLHRFIMNNKGTNVRKDRIIYNSNSGIVDVSKGPGGWLYFLTRSTLFRIVRD